MGTTLINLYNLGFFDHAEQASPAQFFAIMGVFIALVIVVFCIQPKGKPNAKQ